MFASFSGSLQAAFGIKATDFGYLANSYDASFVLAYATLWAASVDSSYDGRTVAEGLARLSAGYPIDLGAAGWIAGKSHLLEEQQINIIGTSGPLDFDAEKGEAPGSIEVWKVDPDTCFVEVKVINPDDPAAARGPGRGE